MKISCTLILIVAGAVCEDTVELLSGNVEDRTRLLRDLRRDYERTVNPDNPEFTFGLSLIDVNLEKETSTLRVSAWLRFVWKDSRLSWDEADYGGVGVLRAESDIFWKPDMTLYNDLDLSRTSSSCWKSNVLLYPSGDLLWVPSCRFRVFCKHTLNESPFETQNCSLKFGSWTYDSTVLDVNLNNIDGGIDLSEFRSSSDWTVVRTTAVKNINFYACCDELYADLTFNLTLKRKPASDSLCFP